MTNCSKCGALLEDGAGFCPNCGQAVAQDTYAPAGYGQYQPGYPPQQPLPEYEPEAVPASNDAGVAGFVFGVMGLASVNPVFAVIAIILGAVGRKRAAKLGGAWKGLSTAGLVLGILVLALFVISAIIFFIVISTMAISLPSILSEFSYGIENFFENVI